MNKKTLSNFLKMILVTKQMRKMTKTVFSKTIRMKKNPTLKRIKNNRAKMTNLTLNLALMTVWKRSFLLRILTKGKNMRWKKREREKTMHKMKEKMKRG